MITPGFQKYVQTFLQKHVKQGIIIQTMDPVGGGCISNAIKIHSSLGLFFMKWNDDVKLKGIFEAEEKGLNILNNTKSIRIPEVVGTGNYEGKTFIVLEFLEKGNYGKDFFSEMGVCVAGLHKHTIQYFGLDHDNYIGSLEQKNYFSTSGVLFFIDQRLKVQVNLALKNDKINSQIVAQFDKLYTKLPNIIPEEQPSLLHGDLWSGNFMADENGNPCLYDPAVYYGNREADIAMTKLFGGFEQSFYDSYHHSYPLYAGWQERVDLWNLYPLLVHLNLFGGSYFGDIQRILKRYI